MNAIDPELVKWKESHSRRPLLVRGARQVGKTYSIIEFAKAAFRNTLSELEFEYLYKDLQVKLLGPR